MEMTYMEKNAMENALNKVNLTSSNSKQEIDLIERYLGNSKHFLEFGSGYSTILATNTVGNSIISIETDVAYLRSLQFEISSRENKLPEIDFLYVDVGPVGHWGTPLGENSIRKWPNYQVAPLNFMTEKNWKPDLALIDGRFRVATFMSLYLNFPGVKIIFDDYGDRPHYHVVENILKPMEKVGRVSVFKVPQRRTRKKIAEASRIMADFILVAH